jgi:hypothetical protein
MWARGKNTSIVDLGSTTGSTGYLYSSPQFETVAMNMDKTPGTFGIPVSSLTPAYEGKCFAMPICLVHRRNQGGYNATYNPNGTKLASDGLKWYNTAVSFTSIADCFTDSKLLANSGSIASGVNGRAD